MSAESCIQFLQTRSHFMQNFKLDKMFYLNIRTCHQLEVWDLKTSFQPIGSKRITKPSVQNPTSNFTIKYSFYPESTGKSNEYLKY